MHTRVEDFFHGPVQWINDSQNYWTRTNIDCKKGSARARDCIRVIPSHAGVAARLSLAAARQEQAKSHANRTSIRTRVVTSAAGGRGPARPGPAAPGPRPPELDLTVAEAALTRCTKAMQNLCKNIAKKLNCKNATCVGSSQA